MKVSEHLGKIPRTLLTLSGFVLVILLGLIDYLTGPDLSFVIFYLFPISFIAWFAGKQAGIFIAIASAIAWLLADIMTRPSYSHFIIPYWNVIAECSVFFIVVHIFSMLKTVLEREQNLNKELEQNIKKITELNKEMEAFNYSVSHDLRTPLIVIGGFSRRLLKTSSNKLDTKGREELNIIQENVQKMTQFIDELLAFSRSERQQMKLEDVDMEKLARTILDELKIFVSEKTSINIKDLPPAHGDKIMLHQVYYNLISNAIKFSRHREMAVIEIGCKHEKNGYTYYVKDNGAGFDMRYADKLFNVFQRLHKEDEFEGTGIGLAIVQRIINRHGGQVWAEGKVDEGATFSFSLPETITTITPVKNEFTRMLPESPDLLPEIKGSYSK
jgi:signal transduction histidine kinase